jgi:hypothetical protein
MSGTKPPHVFLVTDRMVLHRFTMDDADLLIELDNDRLAECLSLEMRRVT